MKLVLMEYFSSSTKGSLAIFGGFWDQKLKNISSNIILKSIGRFKIVFCFIEELTEKAESWFEK